MMISMVQKKFESQLKVIQAALPSRVKSLCKAYVGALFIGLGAQVSIPLWFTPVPITGQTFALLLVGVTLGSRDGVKAVLFYMAQGALGLPFWAGGAFGAAVLIGPTGGYIWAYLLQVYLVGKVAEKRYFQSKMVTFVLLLSISMGQLLLGSFWLAMFVPIKQCIQLGFLPFVFGASFKVAALMPYLGWIQSKREGRS